MHSAFPRFRQTLNFVEFDLLKVSRWKKQISRTPYLLARVFRAGARFTHKNTCKSRYTRRVALDSTKQGKWLGNLYRIIALCTHI